MNKQEKLIQDRISTPTSKDQHSNLFIRLKQCLMKTRQNIGYGFIKILHGNIINNNVFEKIEEKLITSDVGIHTTNKLLNKLLEDVKYKNSNNINLIYDKLREEMTSMLIKVDQPLFFSQKKPFIILIVGVNGVGKTTTIGKLSYLYKNNGKKVMLVAGDTFRAAALEQLQIWGNYNHVPVISQHIGADAASVIFDAINSAQVRNIDVLIIDTAGRLHNKSHLMHELEKIIKVIKKIDITAPHEIMLIIDATTGQNAINQAELFHKLIGITGITLTKLDGSSKGGVIFAVSDIYNIPIRYIGVGEKINDLHVFKSIDFINALFS